MNLLIYPKTIKVCIEILKTPENVIFYNSSISESGLKKDWKILPSNAKTDLIIIKDCKMYMSFFNCF